MIRFTRWSRQFHRWLAYGFGAVVALWVVTGVVMIFPPPATTRAAPPPGLDPAAALRPPSEAARALPATGDARVRSVELRDLGGRLVYRFGMQSGEHVFVDAATAQRVDFTESLALTLARGVMIDTAMAQPVRRITTHDAHYRFGSLPAYRIQLRDAQRTLIHVAADGSISATSKRSRLRAIMGSLHEFQLPGNRIPNRPRKLLILGASALTIILVVTGYVLVLPVRRSP